MLLLLGGCGTDTEPQVQADVPEIRISMTCTTKKPRDLKLVNDRLSEISMDKIGCRMSLVWMEHTVNNDYHYFKDDDAIDIMSLSYSRFLDYQKKGFLMKMDNYLEHEGSQLLEVMGSGAKDFAMQDGHIYGIPKPMPDINSNGLMFSKSLLDKYHISVDDFKTFEDLEPALAKIRREEPDVIPFARNIPSGGLIQRNPIGDVLDGMLSMVEYGDESLTVKNIYETQEYEKRIFLAKRWYDMGYLGEEPAAENEMGEELVFAGKAFATEFVIRPDEVEYAKNIYQDAVEIISFDHGPYLCTQSDWAYLWTISAHCAYPKEAVKALNLLYSDKDCINTVLYGISDVHYVKNGDGTISYPKGVDSRTVGYFNNSKWLFNRMDAKLWEGMPADIMETLKNFNQTAEVSPAYGFRFDASQLTFDLEPLERVLEQYRNRLEIGMFDSEEELYEFQEQLRKAGADELTQEVQRQLDEWKQTME